MDLSYFESVIPATGDIIDIVVASGWALLLGNLVFQAAKSMMSGLGFEGEDPKTLFARTFVFGFLLLASRQICEIGLGISGTVIDLLQIPPSVSITLPGENVFSIGASWLLVIIIGFVLMWQIVKLFFEIGERYFLVGFLTITAPWAFAMGGSKNTADIFKGWARMFASMCFMMVLNVIFLKMILSAMGYMPSASGVIPWMIFVVAIARVARKIDNVVARIGLNPALTGDGLGSRFPGMLSYMVVKSVASTITKTAGASSAGKAKPSGSKPPPPSGTSASASGQPGNQSSVSNQSSAQNSSNANNQSSSQSTSRPGDTRPGTAGTAAGGLSGGTVSSATPGTAETPQGAAAPGQSATHQFHAGSPGTAGTERTSSTQSAAQSNSTRRTSVLQSTRGGANRPGMAGRASGTANSGDNRASRPSAVGAAQPGASAQGPGTAGSGQLHSEGGAQKASRFSNVPPGIRGSLGKSSAPGTAGTGNISSSSRVQHGGSTVGVHNQSRVNAEQTSGTHDYHGSASPGTVQPKSGSTPVAPTGFRASGDSHSTPGTESRRSSVADKVAPAPTNASGTPLHHAASTAIPNPSSSRPTSPESRHGRNEAPMTPGAAASTARPPAPQGSSAPRSSENSRIMQKPSGTAGIGAQNQNTSAAKTQTPPYKAGTVGQGTTRINGIGGMPGRSTQGKKSKKKNRRSKGE